MLFRDEKKPHFSGINAAKAIKEKKKTEIFFHLWMLLYVAKALIYNHLEIYNVFVFGIYTVRGKVFDIFFYIVQNSEKNKY